MKTMKSVSIGILHLAFCMLHCLSATAAEPLIPADLSINQTFKPGNGSFVGRIVLVRGEVIVIHADPQYAFRAEANLPLYKDDTIITPEKGGISFELNDQSMISMSGNTKLVINKSVYLEHQERSSFLTIVVGKARLWIRKFADFKAGLSEFEVKTQTSVLGVRGSDFVVQADETGTIVSTLEDTTLEIVSLFAIRNGYEDKSSPVRATVLNAFERAEIGKNTPNIGIRKMKSEEIRDIDAEFPPLIRSRAEKEKATESLSIRFANRPETDLMKYLRQRQEMIIEKRTEPISGGLPSYPDQPKLK